MEGGPDGVRHDLLDLHDEVSLQVDQLVRVGGSQVLLELLVRQLVAGLIFSVVLRVFLHGIVDQVDILVAEVEVAMDVLFRAGS